MSPRSEERRLQDIVEAALLIVDHETEAAARGLDRSSPLLVDAVVRQLAIIGEAASHLSSASREAEAGIPWADVRGMRLLLDHEYHRVDPAVVWATVDRDLPPLVEAVERLLVAS